MQKQAFSLVELSIVLVILGLLTGGILTGQNLIRAAELRAITTEFQTYQTAVNTFRDKYFYLPGDMPNATDFWGEVSSTPATCKTTTTNDNRTCNGNADGMITATYSAASTEQFRFWQHLANAGLIEGSYTGVQADTNLWSAQIGENIPSSKLSNSGWYALNQTTADSGDAGRFDRHYHNRLQFGGQVANQAVAGLNLTPPELWGIDIKMDDGKPAKGRLWAVNWSECTDATSSADLDADYALSEDGQVCRIIFPEAF